MIYLNYRESVFANPLVQDTLVTFRKYLIYIVSLASALILIHILLPIPKNVFRKLLHVAAFTSSIFIFFNGKGWLPGTITLVLFALIVYPALKIAENWQGYAALFVEKKPGEIRSSLLLLFLSQAAITAFSGIVGKPYILVVSTAAWGLGDIAAAWVGRPLGRHKINLPFADHKKSWEGSIAMAVTAFAAGLPGLLALSPYPLPKALLIALIIAVVSSLTEMSSKGGLDTVTVPVVNALTLWIIGMIIN
jgi:dolichol kinase